MIYQLDERKPILKGDYYVAPNAAVIGSVVMEPNSSVWFNVTIRGDNEVITLGENVNVQDGSVIHTDSGKPVVLHRNVSIGHLVMLHGCTIGENSLVGIGAIILDNVTIGRDCLIGAGSLVTPGKTIPDGSVVMGSPGRVLRQMTPEQIEMNTWIAQHYVERATIYRRGLKAIAGSRDEPADK